MLPRHLYLRSPGPGAALWLATGYAGPGLIREEFLTVSREDDAYVDWTCRLSADNGQTWSEPVAIPGAVEETPAGGVVAYPAPPHIDPRTGRCYRFTMRRAWPGNKCYTYDWKTGNHPCVDHVFVSENGGPDQLLRYEDGRNFDLQNPFDHAYLQANNAYAGTHPAFATDGGVFYPVTCFGRTYRDRRGICLFRREAGSVASVPASWHPSNLQPIAPELSHTGLDEPAAACLSDGRILVVCRGHATPSMPGVKWMTLSADAGRTLSPIEEFRYDDGSRLYSPSSIHRFIRSTRNGKLYWLANIVARPPEGQGPRYPLCIAQINESKAAVIKDSVTILDDRRPGEPAALQLSNFAILENRQTLDIEIFVTLLGLNAADFWGADVYRYSYSPPQ